jgi:uncharacterized caspase-like protein
MLSNTRFYFTVLGLATAILVNVFSTAKGQMRGEDETDSAMAPNPRLALVIGQSDYRGARLITGTDDASRIAVALEEAGFEIESGADLEQHVIREKIRALAEKATAPGVNGTIFVYLCGRVAQLNGENILLPVGAPIDRAPDVLLNGFRLNDLINTLKLIPAKARVIVIDAAAPPPQLLSDHNFSPGVAIVEAPEGFLVAFNQAPGRSLPEPEPPMGRFSRALLDAMQQPVTSFGDFFALARQRVFDESHNHQMPWDDDKLGVFSFSFFPPKQGVTLLPVVPKAGGQDQISSLSSDQAFQRVIASDSIVDYQAFLVAFPNDKATPTVQYNLAVRREAEVWAGALKMNTAEAYWTYIEAYPDGGNVEVARQRLAQLSASSTPPAGFAPVVFPDLPPPLPSGELIASSASFPVEFIPNAPSLNLPPIAPTVAAVAATPVPNAIGQQLPRANMPSIRPEWAARVPPTRAGREPMPETPHIKPNPLGPPNYRPIPPSTRSEAIHPVPLPNQQPPPLGHTQQSPLRPAPGAPPQGSQPKLGMQPQSPLRPLNRPSTLGPQFHPIVPRGGGGLPHAVMRATGHAGGGRHR